MASQIQVLCIARANHSRQVKLLSLSVSRDFCHPGKTTLLERIKVTQFSTKTNALQRSTSGFDNVANVPVHWLKDSSELKDSDAEASDPNDSTPTKAGEQESSTEIGSTSQQQQQPPPPPQAKKRSSWLCPAPSRYANAAIVDDANEDEVEEEKTLNAVEALGDIPSPAFTRKVVSPTFPQQSSTSSASDGGKSLDRTDTNESSLRTVDMDEGGSSNTSSSSTTNDASSNKQQQQPQHSSSPSTPNAVDESQGRDQQQPDNAQYDLKPKSKMLALSKIRKTIGMNLGKITAQGVICNFWDLGGRMFDLWERYYSDSDAVIFVWKTPSSLVEGKNEGEEDEDDDSSRDQYDYAHQLSLLETVRSSIPDDVPFLVLGHVFQETSSSSANQTNLSRPQMDVQYSTTRLLPHYHNPYQALFFANAANGQGIRAAMEWLIPIAKRQLKVRETRRPEEGVTDK